MSDKNKDVNRDDLIKIVGKRSDLTKIDKKKKSNLRHPLGDPTKKGNFKHPLGDPNKETGLRHPLGEPVKRENRRKKNIKKTKNIKFYGYTNIKKY